MDGAETTRTSSAAPTSSSTAPRSGSGDREQGAKRTWLAYEQFGLDGVKRRETSIYSVKLALAKVQGP
jgi:hypothetical protein